jgi:hypothetical protein
MVEARRPLLVFSHVSLTMMRPSSLSLLSALAAKTGVGGKKQPLLPMPLPPPMGGGTLRKSKSFAAAAPAATSMSTGPCVKGRPTRKDNAEVGVLLTIMMMRTGNKDDNDWGRRFPDRVGDEFKAPLERD